MCPAPVPHRTAIRRPSPLRSNGALRAIAAVMTGVDPDPADIALLAGSRIDAETLHLATAVALQLMLQTHPVTPEAVAAPAAQPPVRSVPRDAYYLALALSESAPAAPGKAPRAGLEGVAFLEAAALVGAMQSRFLAEVCSQISLTAESPELLVDPKVTLSSVMKSGGRLTRSIRLLADHTARGRREADVPEWVFASTLITVAGIPGTAIVDAGPVTLQAGQGARMAAPVAVDAAEGLWPQSTVRDCLALSAPAVRQWVAALPRHLDGPHGDELVVTPALSLLPFLVSPATIALTGAVRDPAALPLTPGPGASDTSRRGGELLTSLRRGGLPGTALGPDTRLEGAVRIPAAHRDALTVLACAPAADLGREVEVTVNLSVPGWREVADVVRQIREQDSLTLDEPVLAWADREVISGRTHRISVRARVRHGVACRTRTGTAVLLAAGTILDVVGADLVDSGRSHSTLYAVQATSFPGGGQPGPVASARAAAAVA